MRRGRLPLEVIELVTDNLANDRIALKNCALACWAFFRLCRKHLLRSVSICVNPRCETERMKDVVALLRRSPEVAEYTRHLQLHPPRKFLSLPTELKLFSKLESYELLYDRDIFDTMQDHYSDFAKMDLRTKEILVRPMTTLKALRLHKFANFPFYDLLLCCPNIRHLELSDMVVNRILIPTGASSLKPIKLETFCSLGASIPSHINAIQTILNLRQSNGQPVIDFSGIKHLNITCYTSYGQSSLRNVLFPKINQLRSIVLKADVYTELYLSSLGLLLCPFRKTLKEITIYADIISTERDPLYGLYYQLEMFGRQEPNVLESLTYNLTISGDSGCSTEGYYWRKLDQVIHCYTWPMLKAIRINVNLERLYDKPHSVTADFRRRLAALPEEHLPGLFMKCRKDLDFRFFAR